MNEKPEIKTLAGIAIGDAVRLPSMAGVFQVIAIPDESTLTLRSQTGREVRAGWRAVSKVNMRKKT